MSWLLDKFGYVSKRDAIKRFNRYKELVDVDSALVVEKHNLQRAWEQMKQERKQMRVH